jgi:hypothetical protein
MGSPGLVDARKYHFLRSDSQPVAVPQHRDLIDGCAVDFDAVAAAQVFDLCAAGANQDARVPAGNERVLDGQVAIEATPDERAATRKIELLQHEPQTVARHFGTILSAILEPPKLGASRSP